MMHAGAQRAQQPAAGHLALVAIACLAASACGLDARDGVSTPPPPAAAASSSASPSDASTATLLVIRGTVRVRLPGTTAWADVAASVALPPESDVRTLAASVAELQFPDGSVARVAPESALRVQAYPRTTRELRTDLRLYGGEVWQTVQRLDGQTAETQVATDVAIALVRGTGYDVAAGDVGSRIAVAVGTVEVETAGGTVTLGVKEGLRVAADGSDEPFDATELLSSAWAMSNIVADILLGEELIDAAAPPSEPASTRQLALRTVSDFYTTLPEERVRQYTQRTQEALGFYAFIEERPGFDAPEIDAPGDYRVSERFEAPLDVPQTPSIAERTPSRSERATGRQRAESDVGYDAASDLELLGERPNSK